MNRKYDLIHYFDVWGNPVDGWEVNNQCVEFDDLNIDDSCTRKEIITFLKSIGFLSTNDMLRFIVDDYTYDGVIEIYERKGYKPLCSLREKAV